MKICTLDALRTVEPGSNPAKYSWQRGGEKLFADADLIVGVDEDGIATKPLFWGRKTLQAIVESGRPLPLNTVAIAYHSLTEDLECILALVTLAKGSHDYVAGVPNDQNN